MDSIAIIETPIPINIYRSLRVKCGLSNKTVEACEIGLSNSVYSVMLKHNGEVVGMGRIIGDGGCFCQIVDICVDPDLQGKGLGKMIMQNLTTYIQEHLPPTCYISLIADGEAAYLYEKFGFRAVMPDSKGMYIKR